VACAVNHDKNSTMTTNVYDKLSGLLTSDARWSFEDADWLVYVDDTDYDKIAFDAVLGFLFAGSILNIDVWKCWVEGGRIGPAPMGNLDGTSIIIVNMANGDVEFTSDYMLASQANGALEALYAGSGGPFAKDCWTINRCAKTAVETAKTKDFYSGGQIKYVDRQSTDNNVSNNVAHTQVNDVCKQRGFIMDLKKQDAPMLVKDAANDPSNAVAQSIAQKVMQGKAVMSAPFPGIRQPWTQEKKQELADVLDRFSVK